MRWNITVRFNKKSDWSKKISERANVGKGLENIKFINLLLCLVLNALQQRLLFWIFILCFVKGLSARDVTPEGRLLIEAWEAWKIKRRMLELFEVMLTRLLCLCLLGCLTLCNFLRCKLETCQATRTIIDITPRPRPKFDRVPAMSFKKNDVIRNWLS